MKENNFKKPRTIINIRIDEDLREEFRIKTIKNKTTMSEVTTNFIKEYIKK